MTDAYAVYSGMNKKLSFLHLRPLAIIITKNLIYFIYASITVFKKKAKPPNDAVRSTIFLALRAKITITTYTKAAVLFS